MRKEDEEAVSLRIGNSCQIEQDITTVRRRIVGPAWDPKERKRERRDPAVEMKRYNEFIIIERINKRPSLQNNSRALVIT